MPFVTFQTSLQVFILLLLQEIVVVAALVKEAAFDAQAVIADLFGDGPESIFVVGDERGVFLLLVLVGLDECFFLDLVTLEFEDALL